MAKVTCGNKGSGYVRYQDENGYWYRARLSELTDKKLEDGTYEHKTADHVLHWYKTGKAGRNVLDVRSK